MNRNTSGLAVTAFVAALLCAGALTGCGENQPSPPRPIETGVPSTPGSTEAAEQPTAEAPTAVRTKVIRVIDGDTVAVKPVADSLESTSEHNGVAEHTVRILGINAPEMNYHKDVDPECGAKAATDHLGGTLAQGLPVTIQYDAKADRTDHYGRSLAYVATPNGTDAGLQQIVDGYAMPWYPKDRPEPERMPEYRMAADTAVNQHAGTHSHCETIGRR
ncbi:thermonuclease family protein [Saccharopolyspora hattusasensis]|uniref:thermonuclease family protein n=1 Tax=Saccharopolyspora hattusasensis TaxID=1128679 RepID=UPI003D953D96